jgi:FkbM family methyltransferase
MHAGEHIKLLYRAWKYWYAEANEIRYIRENIKKGSVAFDVGAHKGGYTYWMRKAVGKKGMLVAFEPQPRGAALLKKLFKNKNVRVEQLALSDKKGTALLYIQPQSFDVSFEASLDLTYENAFTERVDTLSIDGYCQQYGLDPSFIKIDVEGHEQKVIDGAGQTLARSRPFLLIEMETRHTSEQAVRDLQDQLASAGYRGYFFSGRKKLSLDDFDAKLHQDLRHVNTSRYSNNFVFEPR